MARKLGLRNKHKRCYSSLCRLYRAPGATATRSSLARTRVLVHINSRLKSLPWVSLRDARIYYRNDGDSSFNGGAAIRFRDSTNRG